MKHKESLNKKKIRILLFISFLFGFSSSLTLYISSSFYQQVSGTGNVGIFYIIPFIFTLIFLLNLHKLVGRFGKSTLLLFFFVVQLAFLSGLIAMGVSLFGMILLMAYLLVASLVWASLDALLESFSVDSLSGRIRGLYLTISNVGFLFGPFISTSLLDRFGYASVFLVVLVIYTILFAVSAVGLGRVNHDVPAPISTRKLFSLARKRPDIVYIYWISFTLEFFYAIMTVFMPLYLLMLGLSWGQIGIIFSIMLLPFVLLQYPVGRIADIRLGEKELIIASILVMVVSSFSIYFIESTSVMLWSAVLFATRVGAAIVDSLRDSYFYKRIDGNDIGFIHLYRTAQPMGIIVASFLSGIFLLTFSLQALFVLLAIIVFVSLYPAFQLEDNRSEQEF